MTISMSCDDVRSYRAVEHLRNGAEIEIRALRPADRQALLEAVGGMSDKSVYRRFFALKREFSEIEVARFLEIDFRHHVALVAVEQVPQQLIVGGARYVVIEPGKAELACAVVDRLQGQGLGKLLLRHLYAVAAGSGVRELIAEVLPDNLAMLKLFQAAAPNVSTRREVGVVHVVIPLTAPEA